MNKITTYRNIKTGETAPAHYIGTDNEGRELYAFAQGWAPVEPYESTEDGWVPAGLPSIHSYAEAVCREFAFDDLDELTAIIDEIEDADFPEDEQRFAADLLRTAKALELVIKSKRVRLVACILFRPGDTGVEKSRDCDVIVFMEDGRDIRTAATVVRDHDGRWVVYGPAPDFWLGNPQPFDSRALERIKREVEAAANDPKVDAAFADDD